MYFPPPRVDYCNADTSRFDVHNAGVSTAGFVVFTKEFKYLGSIIDSSLTSDADVDRRIRAATSAFGALKNVLTSLPVDLRVKCRIYNALVLSIFSMVAKPGACEKTPSIDYAPFTIAAYVQCAASQWPARSNTASHPRACSGASASVLSTITLAVAYYARLDILHAYPWIGCRAHF
jgi:hypothetical protein